MAVKTDETLFAEPWNGSDIVLLVEEKEIHVHKCILIMQSPVFKAMFEGQFQEARLDKITLKEKAFKSMVKFLQALYPSSLFGDDKTPLDDKGRLTILALADEYQCMNLIKQCMKEVKITPENVLEILPYAIKYNKTVLPELYDIIKCGIPTEELKELPPTVESNAMLLTKCRFLESDVIHMQKAMVSLLSDFLRQKQKADSANESLKAAREEIEDLKLKYGVKDVLDTSRSNRRRIRRYRRGNGGSSLILQTQQFVEAFRPLCGHEVSILQIGTTKSCIICQEAFKKSFIDPVPSCRDRNHFFNMVQRGDEVSTAFERLSGV